MTGLSTALITPKMRATISSVSAFAVVLWPESTMPGTSHAARARAAIATRIATTIRSRGFMALFLPHTAARRVIAWQTRHYAQWDRAGPTGRVRAGTGRGTRTF